MEIAQNSELYSKFSLNVNVFLNFTPKIFLKLEKLVKQLA